MVPCCPLWGSKSVGTLGGILGNMEMEPDIENMTISEYLEYEDAKERRLWDDDDDSEEDQEEDGDDGILLIQFGDEILNVTMVDDEADFNPTKDLEELERLLAKEPYYTGCAHVVVLGYYTSYEEALQTGLVGYYTGG
ncbi:hypothetical protein Tco_0733119, partial [Tanacetum coccineum]